MDDKADLVKALNGDVLGMTRDISAVLESTDFGVRAEFRNHFQREEKAICGATATAASMLSLFTAWLRHDDIDRIRVVGMLNTALILQLSSFKLFMFGQTVASGALFRQVIEGVSLAFLFSVKSLPFLGRYEANKYTGKDAVRDLKRHAEIARVNSRALTAIGQAYEFNHRFAHLSKLTVAASANFSKGGIPYFGAQFDAAKLPEYTKEARNRARFAHVLPNAVAGVCGNLAKW
jgi:hypothetical protein